MLCTHCHRPINPVVAVDIDGTLGDYHAHFINFAMGWMGIDFRSDDVFGQTYDGRPPFGEWFCEFFKTDITTFRNIKLAYRQGGQKRTMPPFRQMIEAVQTFRADGAEIWLCTTRPYLRLDGIDPDTREWLRRNRVPYDGLLYDEDKYAKLAEYVGPNRVVAVVDDLAEQYDAAAEIFGPEVPVLRGTRYNRNVTRTNMATSASRLYTLVKTRLVAWRVTHAKTDGNGAHSALHLGQPARATESSK